jgi:hypothetical protein
MSVRNVFLLIAGTVAVAALIVGGMRLIPDSRVPRAADRSTKPRHVKDPERLIAPATPPEPTVQAVTEVPPPAEPPKPAVVAAEAPPAPGPRTILKGERVTMIEQVRIAQVVNPTPVADESVEVSEGAVCDARGYGTLTVVGLDGDRVLVRYRRSVRQKARLRYADEEAGQYPDCPSGTLFFIKIDHYDQITRKLETDKVKKLLGQER